MMAMLRSNRCAVPVLAAALAVTLLSAPARGQDVATAEALFDRGVADMSAGRVDAACPAIAESLRLDPRPGTLFTLAECYAKAGKLASAVARYQDYLALFARMTPDQQSKQLGREAIAEEQRQKLKRDVPTLTVKLQPGAPSDTIVKRGETILNRPSLGVALPLDPGTYTISSQAPSGAESVVQVTLAAGESKEVVLDVKPAPNGAQAKPKAEGPRTGVPRESAPASPAQRIAAYAVGGVGLAGLTLGVVAGAMTLAAKSDIEEHCDLETNQCKDQRGVDLAREATLTGTLSTVGFAIGGAAVATGLVLLLTAPSEDDPAPMPTLGVSFGAQGGSLSVSGKF